MPVAYSLDLRCMKKLGSIFPLITLTLLGSMEMARCQEASPPVNAYTQSVTREVLASGYPNDAQGRILELVRYTIPLLKGQPKFLEPIAPKRFSKPDKRPYSKSEIH